jgi:hypothetical protein
LGADTRTHFDLTPSPNWVSNSPNRSGCSKSDDVQKDSSCFESIDQDFSEDLIGNKKSLMFCRKKNDGDGGLSNYGSTFSMPTFL